MVPRFPIHRLAIVATSVDHDFQDLQFMSYFNSTQFGASCLNLHLENGISEVSGHKGDAC